MTGSVGRPAIRSIVVIAIVAALLFSVGASSAAAQDDAATDQRVVRLVGSYEVQPARGQVDVVEEITVSNVRGSRRSGNTITSYFWTGHTIWLPADSENVSIQVEGNELDWEVVDTIQGIDIISADYRRNLNFGQTRVIDITYTLPTYAPGSGERRINEAFFFLDMVVCCDFEEVDLTVSIPSEFEVVPPTSLRFDSTVVGGRQEFNYTDNEVTGQFTELIFTDWAGFNDAGMARATATVGQTSLELIYPPDDQSWGTAAGSDISEIGTALEALIGEPFPVEDLVIRQGQAEDFELWGGTGPFDEPLGIPRDYDRPGLAAAMARTWLAAGPFEDETVTIGIAFEFASNVVAENDERPSTPAAPTGSGPLNSEGRAWVIRQITNEIGLEGLTQILQMAADNETAYVGEGAAEQTATIPSDWRRFIDLAEQRLGSRQAGALFEEHVLDEEAIAELGERSAALDAYQELHAAADGVVPFGIRNAMTNWEFDEAETLLTNAQSVVAERDRVIGDNAERRSDTELALGQDWADAESVGDLEAIRTSILDRESALNRAGLIRWVLIGLVALLAVGAIIGGLVFRRRKDSEPKDAPTPRAPQEPQASQTPTPPPVVPASPIPPASPQWPGEVSPTPDGATQTLPPPTQPPPAHPPQTQPTATPPPTATPAPAATPLPASTPPRPPS